MTDEAASALFARLNISDSNNSEEAKKNNKKPAAKPKVENIFSKATTDLSDPFQVQLALVFGTGKIEWSSKLTREQLDQVAEERDLTNVCGYPTCSNASRSCPDQGLFLFDF